MNICNEGCCRSRSSSKSSASARSSSSSPVRKQTKKKTKRGGRKASVVVKSAKEKAARKKADAFAKAAQREQLLKDREVDRVRAKQISLASSMIAKIKKPLAALKSTMIHRLICHVPAVTIRPLEQVIKEWDHRIKTLVAVEKGESEWQASMSTFQLADGKKAEKPVLAIIAAMAKFHK